MRRAMVGLAFLVCSLLGGGVPAFAAGECDGRAQPLTISILSDGAIYLQEVKVASYRELNEKLSAIGSVDCMYIRMDEDTPWHVAREVLFPLGVVGDLRTGSILTFSKAHPRSLTLFWVIRGYHGRVAL